MVATTIIAVIGGVTISDDVIFMDISMRNKFQLSSAVIHVDNSGNQYGGSFLAGEATSLSIDGVTMFVGEVETVNTDIDPSKYDKSWMEVTINGPDHELKELFITRTYPYSSLQTPKADDVISDALTLAGATYTYASPSAAPEYNTSFNRSFLTDGFKKIASGINWDGYISMADILHFFEEGVVGAHTTVDLLAIADDPTSNILNFIEGEEDADTVKNYIEMSAGELKDHYTDDIAHWAGAGATSVSAEYTHKLPQGKMSIRLTRASPGDNEAVLELPYGGYTYWNLFSPGKGYYWVWSELIAGEMSVKPRLRDYHGNIIEFKSATSALDDQGTTENIVPRVWHQVDMPYGQDHEIFDTVIQKNNKWNYITRATQYQAGADYTTMNIDVDSGGSGYTRLTLTGGAGIFSNYEEGDFIELENCTNGNNDGVYEIQTIVSDFIVILWEEASADEPLDANADVRAWFRWQKINRFGVYATPELLQGDVIIDFLSIPTLEVIDIVESAASQALYNKRMFYESHTEITSQADLEAFNDNLLEKRKWPLTTAKCWARGQTGSLYAAQSLDVHAPVYGINSLTKYRILSLRHMVRPKDVSGFFGENFVTYYDLVAHTAVGTQEVDVHRFNNADAPGMSSIEELRRRVDVIETIVEPISVSTYSRIPADGELSGLILFDTEANILASTGLNDGATAFSTDTKIWWGWNVVDSDDDWDELTRAQAVTLLNSLLEKDHDSTDTVTDDQHHNQSHKARHETAAGADALDTQNTGAHVHTVNIDSGVAEGAGATQKIDGYIALDFDDIYTDTGKLIVGGSISTKYCAGSSGGATTIPFKALSTAVVLSTSRDFLYDNYGTVAWMPVGGYPSQDDIQLGGHVHNVGGGTSEVGSGGSHDHNVTTSPTSKLRSPIGDGKILVDKDNIKYMPGGAQMVVPLKFIGMTDGYIPVLFDSRTSKKLLIKKIKQMWHDRHNIVKMATRPALPDPKKILPDVLDWDEEEDNAYMKDKLDKANAGFNKDREDLKLKKAGENLKHLFE
jgi:hypothetical protein